jgi:ribulose-5-phosphate 4-epimerase/fuculose-1-phosphate aldolase
MDHDKVAVFRGQTESMQPFVSDAEWKLRQDLAAAYRLTALHGWSDLIFTHFSARVPGEDDHFLINPYGWAFEEITASSLVKVDVDGQKMDKSPHPVNPAGFAIHSAVHRLHGDSHCVFHLHTGDGIGVSAQEAGLLPLSQQAMIVCADLAYYEYGGAGNHGNEGEQIAAALGAKHFAILRNHGTLAVGRTCSETFLRIYFLERACTIQVRAQSGDKLHLPDPLAVDELASASVEGFGHGGEIIWPAMLRKLDRIDPSYRD